MKIIVESHEEVDLLKELIEPHVIKLIMDKEVDYDILLNDNVEILFNSVFVNLIEIVYLRK